MINQLTIIGLGLIGGSIAHAVRTNNICQSIIAYDIQIDVLTDALQSKIINGYENSIADAAKNADLILIATPLGQFEATLSALKNVITAKTIITDVGSVKLSVINSAEKILKEKATQFVPGHPLAGSEKSGWNAAKYNLFENYLTILTPTQNTNQNAVSIVKSFWEQMQARVKLISPELHDQLLAITSHLPQLLSYSYMNQIANSSDYPAILNYTGNGFKDFTRLAGSNPDIWADICLANRDNILGALEQNKQNLQDLELAIASNNKDQLVAFFRRAVLAKNYK